MKVVPLEFGNHDWYFNGGFNYRCLRCNVKAIKVAKGIIRVEDNFGTCRENTHQTITIKKVSNPLYSLLNVGKDYPLVDPPEGRPANEVWVSVSSTRKVRLLPSEYE